MPRNSARTFQYLQRTHNSPCRLQLIANFSQQSPQSQLAFQCCALIVVAIQKKIKALTLCGCCRCHINALPSTTKCQRKNYKDTTRRRRRCGPEKRLINVLLIINVTAESCKNIYKIIYIHIYDRKSLGKKMICQEGRGRGRG